MSVFYFQSLIFAIVVINGVKCKGELKALDEVSWSNMLEGEWMVEFFAPWCPACQQLQPLWEEFAKWSDDLGIKVGGVDVTAHPGLSGRFMITALPTIFHVKDGVFRQYRGARDKDAFISFVEEKKWQSLEPLSSWKTPQSLSMSLMSYFFKVSMQLRNLHTIIVEDYGVPQWVSYVLFGLATILLGTLLGLVIVVILDYICNKGYYPEDEESNKDKNKEKTDDEYEGEDVIKDDVIKGDNVKTSDNSELRKRKETDAAETAPE